MGGEWDALLESSGFVSGEWVWVVRHGGKCVGVGLGRVWVELPQHITKHRSARFPAGLGPRDARRRLGKLRVFRACGLALGQWSGRFLLRRGVPFRPQVGVVQDLRAHENKQTSREVEEAAAEGRSPAAGETKERRLSQAPTPPNLATRALQNGGRLHVDLP